jgi:hypothetical protein
VWPCIRGERALDIFCCLSPLIRTLCLFVTYETSRVPVPLNTQQEKRVANAFAFNSKAQLSGDVRS